MSGEVYSILFISVLSIIEGLFFYLLLKFMAENIELRGVKNPAGVWFTFFSYFILSMLVILSIYMFSLFRFLSI